jgi:hypothetical protein
MIYYSFYLYRIKAKPLILLLFKGFYLTFIYIVVYNGLR